MREILFRGKRIDNGEWWFGNVSLFDDDDFVEITRNDGLAIGTHKVIPETLGQYTGLTDKNDVKIFEGDIVRRDVNYHDMVISYDVENWDGWLYEDIDDNMQAYSICEFCLKDIEIIGNIHDNPELLETAAKIADKNIAQSGLAPATENFELMEG